MSVVSVSWKNKTYLICCLQGLCFFLGGPTLNTEPEPPGTQPSSVLHCREFRKEGG